MAKSYRNVFIRVTSINETADGGLVIYTLSDIENTLCSWSDSAQFLYYFAEHSADGEIEKTHWHILIRFKSPTPFENIKSRFPYGKIENARNSKNCIQYMVHLNDASKKQYTWDIIHTNDPNTDWYKVQSQARQEITLQSVIEKIVSGEIRQYNQVELITPDIWTKHRTRITNAFDYYTEKVCMDKDRELMTIYFSGSTAMGKTTFAKHYCDIRGLSKCISSASNDILQDYKGEDVLILDDFRGDARKGDKHRTLEFHDFLKLLDPHTRSTGKSRYHNKAFIGDLIIITSTRPLCDLYYDLDAEDKHQLYRRIQQQYQFTADKIFIYEYNETYRRYELIGSMPNVINMPKETKIDLALKMAEAFGCEFTPVARDAIEKLKSIPDDEFKDMEEKSYSDISTEHRHFIESQSGLSSRLPTLGEALEKRKQKKLLDSDLNSSS